LHFQAEIMMKMQGIMLVNDKAKLHGCSKNGGKAKGHIGNPEIFLDILTKTI